MPIDRPYKPVVLCILDGWGIGPSAEGNAPLLASTPHFDRLMADCPHARLITHGRAVGLPEGQMGNSEVGHTTIGAGRVVPMDLVRIYEAVETGRLASEGALTDFIAALRQSGGAAHLFGLASTGGVHSQHRHMMAAAGAIAAAGIKVHIHAITDGRDVAPRSALGYLDEMTEALPVGAAFATVIGRYFALDRDNRWDRVARAHAAMTHGRGDFGAPSPQAAVTMAYDRGENDEFIQPTILGGFAGMRDGDGIFCMNFRADRAREIL